MRVPYITKHLSHKLAQRLHCASGGIAITFLGFIIAELPITPVTLRWVRINKSP